MASSNKLYLLEKLDLERLRELANRWNCTVADARLRAPGIAKRIARKRSLTTDDILEAMTGEEIARACEGLGLPCTGELQQLRTGLRNALERGSWRQVRRKNVHYPAELDVVAAWLLEVVDGDTIRAKQGDTQVAVRLRGVDSPETGDSDKAERELDRTGIRRDDMRALGETAKARLQELLAGRRIYLHCQPTPGSNTKYLQHRGRLLAYVSLDTEDGTDVGEQLLRGGYALVWPRRLKTPRYWHPRAEHYVSLCNQALADQPGLWARGLGRLCPRFEQPERAWENADCTAACFPGQWSGAAEEVDEQPAGKGGGDEDH